MALAVAATAQGADAVNTCRAAHGGNPGAHIACLEDALRARGEPADIVSIPAELGAEQVRAAQRAQDASEDRATVQVQIVAVSYNFRGRGVFRMTDGQVWRETEKTSEPQRLAPDTTYRARIERGKLGGYRMYVEGVRRMLKVERVE